MGNTRAGAGSDRGESSQRGDPSRLTESGEQLEPSLDILIVEDEADLAATVSELLRDRGHRTTVLGDGARALQRLEERSFDLIIADVQLPGADGMTIFRRVKDSGTRTPVILMTAYGSIADAVRAVKNDAAHYLAKPFSSAELLRAVADVAEQVSRRQRLRAARQRAGAGPDAAIVGDSPAIVALRQFVRTVADADGPVLITGETGTGKELVASTIHALSRRRDHNFVAVNCAAFPDTLLESELFGHERGAFTGAVQRREGRFRTAHGGTLFLDEIGDMASGAQAKLLRVLEDGSFQPLGSDATRQVDVRILSATNADLRAAVGSRFREDLFYRLKMFHVHVPSLRDRRADLPLLVEHFLSRMTNGGGPPRVTPRAWAALTHYAYPGNVRELRSALGHALAVSQGEDIDVRHLPAELRGERPASPARTDQGAVQPLEAAEREFERDYLVRTLQAAEWHKSRAARLLGISRKTLWKKLRDLGIETP